MNERIRKIEEAIKNLQEIKKELEKEVESYQIKSDPIAHPSKPPRP